MENQDGFDISVEIQKLQGFMAEGAMNTAVVVAIGVVVFMGLLKLIGKFD